MWNVDIEQEKRPGIREAIEQLITNSVPHLNRPDRIRPDIQFKKDHIEINWEEKVEVALSGLPDPDIIRARVYRNETILDLHLSGIRINYS